MRKTKVLLAGVALMGSLFAFGAASASHCGSAKDGRNAHDVFGSCEQSDGTTKCAEGTHIGTLGRAIVKNDSQATGVEACSQNGDDLVIAGRIAAYKDANNNVVVAADGSDNKNSGGAAAWDRVDAGANGVCVRRGTSGTYHNGKDGGMGTSRADSVNASVGPGGAKATDGC